MFELIKYIYQIKWKNYHHRSSI